MTTSLAPVVVGCAADAKGSAGASGTSSSASTGAGGSTPGDCDLYPAQTEGPFYLDDPLERKDITEGLAGVALTLRITVRDDPSCAPIEGAVVDLWHADADGVYSGFAGQLGGVDTTGQDFLRGVQLTDAGGVAEILTIYPGWYPGRTAHIHVKIHLADREVLTSQLYFPEEVSAAVYASGGYADHGPKDTDNAGDSIMGSTSVMIVTGDVARGLVASITLGL